jgi:hypothetical protein
MSGLDDIEWFTIHNNIARLIYCWEPGEPCEGGGTELRCTKETKGDGRCSDEH